jgi:hypothetical protein
VFYYEIAFNPNAPIPNISTAQINKNYSFILQDAQPNGSDPHFAFDISINQFSNDANNPTVFSENKNTDPTDQVDYTVTGYIASDGTYVISVSCVNLKYLEINNSTGQPLYLFVQGGSPNFLYGPLNSISLSEQSNCYLIDENTSSASAYIALNQSFIIQNGDPSISDNAPTFSYDVYLNRLTATTSPFIENKNTNPTDQEDYMATGVIGSDGTYVISVSCVNRQYLEINNTTGQPLYLFVQGFATQFLQPPLNDITWSEQSNYYLIDQNTPSADAYIALNQEFIIQSGDPRIPDDAPAFAYDIYLNQMTTTASPFIENKNTHPINQSCFTATGIKNGANCSVNISYVAGKSACGKYACYNPATDTCWTIENSTPAAVGIFSPKVFSLLQTGPLLRVYQMMENEKFWIPVIGQHSVYAIETNWLAQHGCGDPNETTWSNDPLCYAVMIPGSTDSTNPYTASFVDLGNLLYNALGTCGNLTCSSVYIATPNGDPFNSKLVDSELNSTYPSLQISLNTNLTFGSTCVPSIKYFNDYTNDNNYNKWNPACNEGSPYSISGNKNNSNIYIQITSNNPS